MAKRRFRLRPYEKILYSIAIVLIFMTLIAIYKDKGSLQTYYNEKNSQKIAEQDQKNFLKKNFRGSGTEKDPYIIQDITDLKNIKSCIETGINFEGMFFKQINDIDFSRESMWMPVSPLYTETSFCGTYDGFGHKMLNVNLVNDNTSIFGKVGGTIKNLGVDSIHFSASNCAAFINCSAENKYVSLINCFVENISQDIYSLYNVSFANDFSRGTLINCFSNGNFYFINYAENDSSSFYNCNSTFEFYENKDLLIYQENCNEYISQDERFISIWNEELRNLNCYGIIGNFFELKSNPDGTIEFSERAVEIKNIQDIENYNKFFRNIFFYFLIFLVDIIFCLCFTKRKGKDKEIVKYLVYSLLSICIVLTIGYAFLTKGESLIALLYDGRTDGRLKVFTDFFDCVRPGFDPYHNTETGTSTIYPPLITLLFAVLGRFIPQNELYSSIAAKDSQMGSLIFALCIAVTAVFLYEVICKYKKGTQLERRYFFFLFGMTYPMIHCIERGNVAILSAIFMTLFLYNYRSDEQQKKTFAWVCLSIAAGIKIYPAILGILLIRERRFKDTVDCLAYGIILNILPSVFFKTGLSSIAYMVINAKTMVSNNAIIGGKIDLAHLLQLPAEIYNFPTQKYNAFIQIGLVILSVVIIFLSRLKDWKIYTLLILDIILLTSFGPFYYILYLLAPLMMFLDSNSGKAGGKILYSILFVCLFMPFASLHKYPLAAIVPTQSVWNMTLIAGSAAYVFLIVLIIDGMRSCIKNIRFSVRT